MTLHADGDAADLSLTAREAKEAAMLKRQRTRFEAQLEKFAAADSPRGTKHHVCSVASDDCWNGMPDWLAYLGVADDSGKRAGSAIHSTYHAQPQDRADLPGHYTLRSNDLTLDGEALWRTYVQLTDVESAFRSLQSELGLRRSTIRSNAACKSTCGSRCSPTSACSTCAVHSGLSS